MFTTNQLEKYADVLLWGLKTSRIKPFKKGDIVLVVFDLPAVALAEVLQRKLLERGFHPVLRSGATPGMEHTLYKKANQKQLTFVGPWEDALYERIHGRIFLHAPASLTHLRDIDPGKIGKFLVSRKPLRDIMRKREDQGDLGWTLCTVPTEALAEQAGLTLKQYTNQVIKACYLNVTDPVKEWKTIYKKASAIKGWLNHLDIKAYHIESKNTDLWITHGERRRWVGVSGHNVPSFELFLSPDWRGAHGTYYADQPSFRSGNYVEGVRLSFDNGRLLKAEAAKGEAFVRKQLAMDKGASRLGEFSLTDTRFSKIDRFMANTLYDENYGGRYGNCHVAVGMSYTDTYDGDPGELTQEAKDSLGFNDSALHWDLVNTENKRVTARLGSGDEMVIYEDGRFQHGDKD